MSDHAIEIRQQAEKKLAAQAIGAPPARLEDALRNLHELRVHQIELEIQNEELLHAQHELEVSRERYLDLYDLAPVGYFTLSGKGLILEPNLTLAILLSVARGRLVMQRLSQFIITEDQDKFYRFRHQLLSTPATGPTQAGQDAAQPACELRIVRGDGSLLWVELIASPAPDKDDEKGLRVTVTDISARKRLEEALRMEKLNLDALFECSPIAMLVLDETTNIVRINREALALAVGHRSDDLLQHRPGNALGCVHSSEDPRGCGYSPDCPLCPARKCIEKLITSGGEIHGVEVEMELMRNGAPQKFWIEIGAESVQINGRTHVCVALEDINSRKQAEKALRESEAKYRILVETTNTGFLILNNEGTVIDANAEYVRLTGHRELGDILGKTISEWTAKYDQQRNAAAVAQCVKTGFIRNFVIDYVDGNGRITPVEVNAAIVEANESIRIVSLCRDITERKVAEEAQAKLQDQLNQAQKMESVGRLAGGVAHDFNNLLMGTMGYAEMCLDRLPGDHPLRGYLNAIISTSQRSADLTRQLLAFARRQTIVPKVLDLNDAIASMLKLLCRLIGEDISLVLMPGAGLWPVKLDPSQIDQILANLCVNARDAITDAGKITLATANVMIDQAFCADHEGLVPGAYVLLTVSDDGCGMDEAVLANIFEPFFTTKDVDKGTGLGLATVYGIVKQNGGFIDVESELGKGTTFKIYVPRFAGDGPKAATASKVEAPRGRGETVLLVEDDKSIRETCGPFLEALGYKVLVAALPTAALGMAALHEGDIHLLFTDVVMPGMNGRALAERILANRPALKVLFMSGYTDDVILSQQAPANGLHFILKPFSRDDLARKVREVLDNNMPFASTIPC
jgi:PAS domain S-box-containing protein